MRGLLKQDELPASGTRSVAVPALPAGNSLHKHVILRHCVPSAEHLLEWTAGSSGVSEAMGRAASIQCQDRAMARAKLATLEQTVSRSCFTVGTSGQSAQD